MWKQPTPQPTEQFDCSAGAESWEVSWNLAQKAWCCEHRGIACDPYECSEDAEWTAVKRAWCCNNRGVGCAPVVQPPGTELGAARPAPEPTVVGASFGESAPSFDCDAGLAQWRRVWSDEKKAFCCKEVLCEDSGSDSTAPASPTAGAAARPQAWYDCADGRSTWELWPPSKKSWCCQGGFIPTCDAYDCGDGQQEAWFPDKSAWCCAQRGRCAISETTTVLHFDCSQDAERWEKAWSSSKKAWCCATSKVACDPFDCAPAAEGMWSPEKRDWCCEHKQEGCSSDIVTTTRLPSQYGGIGGDDHDCSRDLDTAKLSWSPAKKVECCIREGKGCPEVEVNGFEGDGDRRRDLSAGDGRGVSGEAAVGKGASSEAAVGKGTSRDSSDIASGFQLPFGLPALPTLGLADARPAAVRTTEREGHGFKLRFACLTAAAGGALLLATVALVCIRTMRSADVGLEGYWPAPASPKRPRPVQEGYHTQEIEVSRCLYCS